MPILFIFFLNSSYLLCQGVLAPIFWGFTNKKGQNRKKNWQSLFLVALALSSVLKILLGPKGLCMFQHTQKSFSWLIKKRDLSLKKNFSRRVEKPREKLCLGWLLLLFVFRCFCLALEAACLCGSTSSSSTSSRCRDGSTAPNLCISPLVININFQAFPHLKKNWTFEQIFAFFTFQNVQNLS